CSESGCRDQGMSEHNPIRVYVGHRFDKSVDYLRVFEYLESVERFYYINVSETEPPKSGGLEALKERVRQQIDASEIVILVATLFTEKPDWAEFQVNAAQAMGKPILLVHAFGRTTVTPDSIVARADATVDWSEREIVDAVKRLARNEDTQRWDVIDFP
ncbi:MAG: TIR domain-containing protein, partial [Pseudomonadota bacterium]